MPQNVIQINRFPQLRSKFDQFAFFISLLTKGHINITKNSKKFVSILKSVDLVLHAPGGPSIGDTYLKAEKLYLWRLRLIQKMKIPYIFYAPSMGPFNNKSSSLKKARPFTL